MQLYGLEGNEWLIIIGVFVLLFFGVKRIPELARSFGKASAEFERYRLLGKKEIQQLKEQNRIITATSNKDRETLESIAGTLGIDYYGKTDHELRIAIHAELNRITKSKK
ncbi:MAG TPA: twin-arginine translocase TatA/TatE family subunit [Nitrososphaeraceae archaeon]|jgi:sec-independent protein translocase protein TatA|nr:twin-arginine translocase TatA/TatE family subunit [Nitrososphaeraceae archaeon]